MIKRRLYLLFAIFAFASIFSYSFFKWGLSKNTVNAQETYLEDLYYETDVNDPASIEQIMEDLNLEAIDQDGHDYTNRLVYVNSGEYINSVLNQPLSYTRLTGTYALSFRAYDNNGNFSTLIVTVNVVDNTAPTILNQYSTLSYTFYMSEVQDHLNELYTIVKGGVFAYDNVNMFDVRKDIESYKITTSSKAGQYTLKVYVFDESGNSSAVNVTVNIIDDIYPYFTMENAFMISSVDDELTPEDIEEYAGVEAYDAYGASLSVEYDFNTGYSKNNTVPGVYVYTFSATDSRDLTSSIEFILLVRDTIGPTITYDDSMLIAISDKVYSEDNLNAVIKFRTGRTDYTYEVICDEYSENYNVEGNYNYKILLTFSTGEQEEMGFVIKVIDKKLDNDELVTKTNFSFLGMLKKIGQIIIGIIKWPIVKILKK